MIVMTKSAALMLALVLLAISLGYSQEAKMDPRIAYAPDIVGVDRIFMIALKVPLAAGEVKVTYPDNVIMFDQTRLPAKEEVRRYYFLPTASRQADLPTRFSKASGA